MRWFRANRSCGGVLALFALAVQLTLSFGHVHRSDLGGGWPVAKSAAIQAEAASGNQPGHGHTDPFCDICATISLVASSQASDAPRVAAAVFQSHAVAFATRDDEASPFRRHGLFQSRAPPSA